MKYIEYRLGTLKKVCNECVCDKENLKVFLTAGDPREDAGG